VVTDCGETESEAVITALQPFAAPSASSERPVDEVPRLTAGHDFILLTMRFKSHSGESDGD